MLSNIGTCNLFARIKSYFCENLHKKSSFFYGSFEEPSILFFFFRKLNGLLRERYNRLNLLINGLQVIFLFFICRCDTI